MGTKQCSRCGETKELDKFHRNQARADGKQAECKPCQLATNRKVSQDKKLKMVEYKGGRCVRCDGEFLPCVFEFHHVDPEQKDVNPRAMQYWRWERITPELDKCILLCANCHRIEHHLLRENNADN